MEFVEVARQGEWKPNKQTGEDEFVADPNGTATYESTGAVKKLTADVFAQATKSLTKVTGVQIRDSKLVVTTGGN